MKKSELAALVAGLRRDLEEARNAVAVLQAWQQGHMCAQWSQPQPVSLPGIGPTKARQLMRLLEESRGDFSVWAQWKPPAGSAALLPAQPRLSAPQPQPRSRCRCRR